MRRLPLTLAEAFVAVVVSLYPGPWSPAVAAADAPFCQPGQPATFDLGIAALHERLGDTMGTPLECEHLDVASGDTVQQATTGLAYYRPSLGAAIFTDGATHWALTNGAVVRWQGGSVTPPLPTDAEAAYLQATEPVRARADILQSRVSAARQQVERGQIESLDAAGLRTLVDELRAARDAYATTSGAGRLAKYHSMMVVSLNHDMGAAELLTQARQIESPDVRAQLLAAAVKHQQESERLQAAADEAYASALPVVVQ
jgi:hypothetical protein